MRNWAIGFGVAVVLGVSGASHADSRVSFEFGGLLASSPIDDGSGGAPPGTRRTNSAMGNTLAPTPSLDTLLAAEVRPVFSLAGGLRLGVGFRAGKAGELTGVDVYGGRSNTTVVGGDVSFGFSRRFGNLMPFGEVRFGFTDFESTVAGNPVFHANQLRFDGVVGSRLYLGEGLFVVGAAFAGWGDRYGATLGLGFDIVHWRYLAVLP